MWKSKLIIFDGIWGSGKTTFSKKLFSQLKCTSSNVKLYLDDMEGHPLYNTDGYSSEEFFKVYCKRLQAIIKEITENETVVIIESIIINGLLFEAVLNSWTQEVVKKRIFHINKLLQQVSSTLVFFHHQNTSIHWHDLASYRGEYWQKYIQKEFENDESGFIKFLDKIQHVGELSFQKLDISNKYQLDITDRKWTVIESLIFSHNEVLTHLQNSKLETINTGKSGDST